MAEDTRETFTYELVPPALSVEFGIYDGSLLRITGRYTTRDRRIAAELDAQKHAVRRVTAKPAKPKK